MTIFPLQNAILDNFPLLEVKNMGKFSHFFHQLGKKKDFDLAFIGCVLFISINSVSTTHAFLKIVPDYPAANYEYDIRYIVQDEKIFTFIIYQKWESSQICEQ